MQIKPQTENVRVDVEITAHTPGQKDSLCEILMFTQSEAKLLAVANGNATCRTLSAADIVAASKSAEAALAGTGVIKGLRAGAVYTTGRAILPNAYRGGQCTVATLARNGNRWKLTAAERDWCDRQPYGDGWHGGKLQISRGAADHLINKMALLA